MAKMIFCELGDYRIFKPSNACCNALNFYCRMDHLSLRSLEHFKNNVGIRFQLYNSLFTALPFHRIEKTGILLSLLLSYCEDEYKKKQSPAQIIESFIQRFTT